MQGKSLLPSYVIDNAIVTIFSQQIAQFLSLSTLSDGKKSDKFIIFCCVYHGFLKLEWAGSLNWEPDQLFELGTGHQFNF